MKKLLLGVMMLCLMQSVLFAFNWENAITRKDDNTWKYTAEQILDAAIELNLGFDFDVWNFAVQHGRSDIIKVLLKEKPGYNATYGDILNRNTGGVKVELGRDERFLFDVSFRYPMRTELQTALYYGQKETAKDMIKLVVFHRVCPEPVSRSL